MTSTATTKDRRLGKGLAALLGFSPVAIHYSLMAMVSITAVGAFILWVFGVATPAVLDVQIGGMHVAALTWHMFVISVFHGFLSLAIGAWTGKTGLASGITAGVMVLSFIGVGLFPLIDGLENVARIFPWYYYSAAEPVLNGVDWGHIGILIAGIAVLAAVAVLGVNRRDLRGQSSGTSVIDRLRSHPVTKKMADGGSPMRIMSRDEVRTMWKEREAYLSELLKDLRKK